MDESKPKKEKFKIPCAVFLILERDGKILLSKRFQTGHMDGFYGMVAGHLDGAETMREAAVREGREEAGIILAEDDLCHVLTQHHCNKEYANIFFHTSKWQGEVKNMEPHKCDDLAWSDPRKLPEDMIPYIRQAVECYLNGTTYCEYGWAAK